MDIYEEITGRHGVCPNSSLARSWTSSVIWSRSMGSVTVQDLKCAQQAAMEHVWDNPDDEVWNDV